MPSGLQEKGLAHSGGLESPDQIVCWLPTLSALRLGWLNAVTADLTVTQVAQGEGLVGTSAVPGLAIGPRKNTFCFPRH